MLIQFASTIFEAIECNHGSFGILPGLLESNHGLLSQNSSLIMSTCCTVILAFARLFLSLSSWVFDNSASSTVFVEFSSMISDAVPGSTNSYCKGSDISPMIVHSDSHLGESHFLSCISQVHCCS